MSEMSDYREIVGPDGLTGLARDLRKKNACQSSAEENAKDDPYQRMLEQTDWFNNGMRHGIDHAIAVIRAAFQGQDIGVGVMNHEGLEALRRDILELRGKVVRLLRSHTKASKRIRPADVPEITRKLSPERINERRHKYGLPPVPEHRLKDYCYDKVAGRDTGYLHSVPAVFADCASDDPDRMCQDCNCWKRTRAYSS